MSHEDFSRVNPNTGTTPVFRTRRDAEITRRIYEKFPVLNHHQKGKVWPIKYFTMFHMTNDSHLFKTKEELERDGFYPVDGNKLKKNKEEFAPLYVGRMIHHYDHRAASVEVNLESLHNPALSGAVSEEMHKNPGFYPTSQYWVDKTHVPLDKNISWVLTFRDIARSTDARTMIATIIPRHPTGNKLPLLIPESNAVIDRYKKDGFLLLSNLNSFAFDFVMRQKLQSTSLNWYIVEQLPMVQKNKFEEKVGKIKIADFIRNEVLALTYTAHDMKPFAMDMGYDGEPFTWDEEDRRHRKARLDALFFNLYEINEEDAAYIMDTFPIVRREDEKAFEGRYYTKDLILAYMKALKAGDTESKIKL
ncbi:MAG: hypothetical protein IID18_01630 [Nitrospinae bacterium]|nr:hypothetical protein [Nitrospinota bacterium]